MWSRANISYTIVGMRAAASTRSDNYLLYTWPRVVFGQCFNTIATNGGVVSIRWTPDENVIRTTTTTTILIIVHHSVQCCYYVACGTRKHWSGPRVRFQWLRRAQVDPADAGVRDELHIIHYTRRHCLQTNITTNTRAFVRKVDRPDKIGLGTVDVHPKYVSPYTYVSYDHGLQRSILLYNTQYALHRGADRAVNGRRTNAIYDLFQLDA